MMLRKALTLSALAIILISGTSHAGPFEDAGLSLISTEFFNLVHDSDFKNATKLFHYPATYSDSEISKDRAAIATVLELFRNEFGDVNNPAINEQKAQILSLQIGGGSIDYWQKHPKFFTAIYQVNFSNYGEGFVTFTFCDISGKFEIREVKYGLSQSRSDVKQLLTNIMSKMQVVLAPFMQTET